MSRSTIGIGLAALVGSLLATGTGAAQGPSDEGRERSLWAVIVGIERYNDPGIPACSRSITEGLEFARWLTETARWDRGHILLMNEKGEPKHPRPEDPVGNLIP